MSDTNDNDLIRFAAKAVGINALIDIHGEWRNCTNVHPTQNIFSVPMWNPLTDDGDALRLAVKLDLGNAVRDGYQHLDSDGDMYAATRRSITRAAAEIGRATS